MLITLVKAACTLYYLCVVTINFVKRQLDFEIIVFHSQCCHFQDLQRS